MAVSKNSTSKNNKESKSKVIEKQIKEEPSINETDKVEEEPSINETDKVEEVKENIDTKDKETDETVEQLTEVSDQDSTKDDTVKEDTVKEENKSTHKIGKYFTYLWNGMSSDF
jgi:hypothetical protein